MGNELSAGWPDLWMEKATCTFTTVEKSMLNIYMPIPCLAIIADVEDDTIKKLGKKKLIECRKSMVQIDRYTFRCPKGHIKKTEVWGLKGLELFYKC